MPINQRCFSCVLTNLTSSWNSFTRYHTSNSSPCPSEPIRYLYFFSLLWMQIQNWDFLRSWLILYHVVGTPVRCLRTCRWSPDLCNKTTSLKSSRSLAHSLNASLEAVRVFTLSAWRPCNKHDYRRYWLIYLKLLIIICLCLCQAIFFIIPLSRLFAIFCLRPLPRPSARFPIPAQWQRSKTSERCQLIK